jgi:DNA-binding CsgD family transcriptional regulator/tetratricopeptide (TPR) repeat protein
LQPRGASGGSPQIDHENPQIEHENPQIGVVEVLHQCQTGKVAERAMASGPVLVERTEELGVVDAFLDRAADGEGGALLLFGDAGVGKTTLVRQACGHAGANALVLTGACLPLVTLTVPFLALRSAVRGADGAIDVSRLGVMASAETSAVPVAFDAWLEELCSERLVVLVVEDLHWSDQSTLDVLMYVAAGPAGRRLAIVGTMRSGEVGEGHPLHRWLADIRRLPRTEQMTLGPLDRVGTGAQIAGILGAPPHESLVEDVFTHTRGNSYLTRLVVSGLAPDARHLAPDLPPDLNSAVLQSWRRLSAPTRELTRVLALAGRPMHLRDLEEVVTGAGDVGFHNALPLLSEAVDAGTIDALPGGAYWFHHPLNAEVLEQSLSRDERIRWHTAFAAHYEQALLHDRSSPDDGTSAVEELVALADHHYRAEHPAEAFQWALRASQAVGDAGGTAEMMRLLRRAVQLREQMPNAPESRRDLLRRLQRAAAAAGAHEDELETVDSLLAGLDWDEQPLLAAELLVRRMHLRFFTGTGFMSVEDMREAVRLAGMAPGSWQHAYALAELAHAELWQEDPEAQTHAEAALALARSTDNPRSLSYALTAVAMAACLTARGSWGLPFATEGVAAAIEADDYWAFVHATLWEANAQEIWSSQLYAELLGQRRTQLMSLGAPHPYIAKLSADEAGSWLAIGRWRECLQALRIALGSNPGPLADAGARLTAARLASWQGRQAEAEAHLARADELFAGRSEFLNFDFDAIRAEVLLGIGRAKEAYDAAMTGAMTAGVPPTMCEWLIPLAARALADLIQAARDDGRSTESLMGRVDELVLLFPQTLREPGEATELWDAQVQALNMIYAAEVGRARQSGGDPQPGNAAEWIRSAEACRPAMLAWEEAYSSWRGAEALLLHGQSHDHVRTLAASVLRRGLELAKELNAVPIMNSLEHLAASARISVNQVVSGTAPLRGEVLPGLTPREREILQHVVADRTYSEIARELVISEKTVSSHISNLLRKTGTTNRMDLARLARTHGEAHGEVR